MFEPRGLWVLITDNHRNHRHHRYQCELCHSFFAQQIETKAKVVCRGCFSKKRKFYKIFPSSLHLIVYFMQYLFNAVFKFKRISRARLKYFSLVFFWYFYVFVN